MTAILQLPRLVIACATAANEDWRDGFTFDTAGEAVGYPAPSNIGNGYVSNPMIVPGAYVGVYVISLTGANAFLVSDPNGTFLGSCLVGAPWSRSGVTFNLISGSTAFVAGDTFEVSVLPGPVDLTGLTFEMDVRAGTSSNSYLYASTENGWLVNGGASGALGFAVPQVEMIPLPPGTLVADILAHGDGVTRCCAELTITHKRGVTAPR